MNHRGTNLILAAIFLAAVCLFSTFRPRSDAPTDVTAPVSPSVAASTSPLPVETVAAVEEAAPAETADASEETAPAETADAEPVKPETEPETTAADALPDIDPAGWELLLVNASHNIGDYAPTLSELEGYTRCHSCRSGPIMPPRFPSWKGSSLTRGSLRRSRTLWRRRARRD